MINLNGMMSPNNHMDRTWGMIAVTVVSAGVGMYNANQEKQDAKGVADEARRERQKQEELLNKQKKEYKAMEFKNPFDNMENAFEDLTVNQQQAQFQSQQGNQQRANIMQNMKGAAGGSRLEELRLFKMQRDKVINGFSSLKWIDNQLYLECKWGKLLELIWPTNKRRQTK